MADERLQYVVVFDVVMVLGHLLEDVIHCFLNFVVIKDKTDVHHDQDHVAFLEVKVCPFTFSDQCSRRVADAHREGRHVFIL